MQTLRGNGYDMAYLEVGNGARHWMFDQAPQQFSRVVLEFLAA